MLVTTFLSPQMNILFATYHIMTLSSWLTSRAYLSVALLMLLRFNMVCPSTTFEYLV